MIVVDGRTDREKLVKLMRQGEQTELEFKSTLDLKDRQKPDRLNFVKDVVALSNLPRGGYMLIGVKDDGMPVGMGDVNRDDWDGACLQDIVRPYVEGQIRIMSQIHALDQGAVVLLYIAAHGDGFPVPFSKQGEYTPKGDKRQKRVFDVGELLVREGAQNVPLRHAHWPILLERHDEMIRRQATEHLDSFLFELTAVLRSSRENKEEALMPLSIGLSDSAFEDAVNSHLERGRDQDVSLFVRTVSNGAEEDADAILDKLTMVAVLALYREKREVACRAIDALFDVYEQAGECAGECNAKILLEIVNRLYVIGSAAVRLKAWGILPCLVIEFPRNNLKPAKPVVWIRDGQVRAIRAGLLSSEKQGAYMLPAARRLMVEHAPMRPDVPESRLPDNLADLKDDDVLLNSLAQFDILHCLVAAVKTRNPKAAYPASSVLKGCRAAPALRLIAVDDGVRQELFAGADDCVVAQAMKEVYEFAFRESKEFPEDGFGNWNRVPPSEVDAFVCKSVGWGGGCVGEGLQAP